MVIAADCKPNLNKASAMVFLVWDGTAAAAMTISAGSKVVALTGYGYPGTVTCRSGGTMMVHTCARKCGLIRQQ